MIITHLYRVEVAGDLFFSFLRFQINLLLAVFVKFKINNLKMFICLITTAQLNIIHFIVLISDNLYYFQRCYSILVNKEIISFQI